jgi:hypothetical protein
VLGSLLADGGDVVAAAVERPAPVPYEARGRWLAYEPGHRDRILLGAGTGLACRADGELEVILDELAFPVDVVDPAPLRAVAMNPTATHVVYVTDRGTAAWLLDLDKLTTLAVAWPSAGTTFVEVAYCSETDFVVLGDGELVLCGDSYFGRVHRLLERPCRGDRLWTVRGRYAITSGATGCQIYAIGDRVLEAIATLDLVVTDVVEIDDRVVLVTDGGAYVLGGLEAAHYRATHRTFAQVGECGPVPGCPATGVDERGDRWWSSPLGMSVIVRDGVLHDRGRGAPVTVQKTGEPVRGDLRVYPDWLGFQVRDATATWHVMETASAPVAVDGGDFVGRSGSYTMVARDGELVFHHATGGSTRIPCPPLELAFIEPNGMAIRPVGGRLAIIDLYEGIAWRCVWPAAMTEPEAVWWFEWECYARVAGSPPRWFHVPYRLAGAPVTDLRSIPDGVPEVEFR